MSGRGEPHALFNKRFPHTRARSHALNSPPALSAAAAATATAQAMEAYRSAAAFAGSGGGERAGRPPLTAWFRRVLCLDRRRPPADLEYLAAGRAPVSLSGLSGDGRGAAPRPGGVAAPRLGRGIGPANAAEKALYIYNIIHI